MLAPVAAELPTIDAPTRKLIREAILGHATADQVLREQIAGVALRGILLWLVLPLDIQSDEANYLYLALVKERLGIYLDQHRYFWPPGYPWLLSKSIHAFGIDGLNVLRGLQVALSSVIGVTTMLFAWRLFSRRAAIVANPTIVVGWRHITSPPTRPPAAAPSAALMQARTRSAMRPFYHGGWPGRRPVSTRGRAAIGRGAREAARAW